VMTNPARRIPCRPGNSLVACESRSVNRSFEPALYVDSRSIVSIGSLTVRTRSRLGDAKDAKGA
jgi:hypothetical protein